MNENTLDLINHSDKKLDFRSLLTLKESIIIENCNNLEIIISSKINKIIINKSNNIIIRINETISGIEIERSDCINIYPLLKNMNLSVVQCYKASVFIYISNYIDINCKNKIPFLILNEYSSINLI